MQEAKISIRWKAKVVNAYADDKCRGKRFERIKSQRFKEEKSLAKGGKMPRGAY